MASQKSRMINLITKEFGLEYSASKSADKKVKQLQKEFFDAATEMLSQQSLATKTVTVDLDVTGEQIQQQYPGWRIIDSHTIDGEHVYLIEEDPSVMAFNYVNPDDHMVYARTTAQGSPMLDDERLAAENPELWEEISDFPEPWLGLVTDAIQAGIEAGSVNPSHTTDWAKSDYLNKLNPQELAANFLADRGISRALKPIDQLTDKQLQAIQDYLVPAPISVRLVPPRKAKQEELEEAGLA